MDPRETGPQARKANLSELMQAKARASQGEVVNACPFGCDVGQLDVHGYCDHLVGFTNDGQTMEPMVQVRPGVRQVKGDQKQPVPRGARLVRITVSSRVYHEGEKTKKAG